MAITLAQSATGTNNSTASYAISLTGVVVGNMVIVAHGQNLPGTICTISDGANTFKQIFTDFVGNFGLTVWYSIITTGGNLTITITGTVSAQGVAREYSGLSDKPLDGFAKVAVASSTNPTSPNRMFAHAPDLLIGAMVFATTTGTSVAGTGYGNYLQAALTSRCALEDKITTTVGAQSASFTTSATSSNYVCGVIGFSTVEVAAPTNFNNFQFVSVGDGMSVSEKIR